MKVTLFFFILFACLVGALLVSAQTIGIYFDPEGTAASITDTTLTYPCVITAYVVAKDLGIINGIDGWEARISWSDSLIVSLVETYGQSINVGVYPEFLVGLADTLGAEAGTAALARLNVVALGPGDLYLSGCNIPSIPESELPAYTCNRSLGAFNFEYGGLGQPCASIGRALAVPENVEQIVLESQFSAMEFRDGELYGYLAEEKSWIALPKFPTGSTIELTGEQFALLSLVPRLRIMELATEKGGDVIFLDGFENYYANWSEPFLPLPGFVSNFYTWYVLYPGFYGEAALWGVTNARAYSGLKSAYCNAITRVCDNWDLEENCSTTYNTIHTYDIDIHNGLSLNALPIDSGKTYEFTCRYWSDIGGDSAFPESADHLLINLATEFATYPIATVVLNAVWSPISYRLPGNAVGNVSINFEFNSDLWDEDKVGVYIDDVAITCHDVDVDIMSAIPHGVEFDVADPNIVTLSIYNYGSTSTGDFSVAFSRGTQFDEGAVEGLVTVPPIGPYGWQYLDVSVPFARAGKQFSETVNQDITFKLDVNDVVYETNELNNVETTSVSWMIPNAPIILVHGLMGGAVTKDNDQYFGSDANKTLATILFHDDRIRRDSSTNLELDLGTMYTPSAYPPEDGFVRDMALLFGLTANPNFFPGLYPDHFDLPQMSGCWDPLINNLTDVSAPEGYYVLPAVDPIGGTGDHEQDIFLFNYDWRLDLNPDRLNYLNGSTPTYARLDSLVNWIKANHEGADRLTIVSYSLGGVLVEAYLRSRAPSHGVYRWISIGTPFQGAEIAMATLFGSNGMGWNYEWGGALVGEKLGNLAKEFVPVWEILPTPYYHTAAPFAGDWRSHTPFEQDLLFYCGPSCDRYPIPIYEPTISIAEIVANPGLYSGWRANSNSAYYASQFQSGYMNHNVAEQIAGVETWLVVGSGVSTLRGVVRYEKKDMVLDPYYDPIYFRRQTQDFITDSGDGVVSEFSASTVNVDPSNCHVVYTSGIRHTDLIRDHDVGNFVADLIRGRDLSSYYGWSIYESSQSGDAALDFKIKWHTDMAIMTDKNEEKISDFGGMPIALDLVEISAADPDETTLLVGMIHADIPADDPDISGPRSITVPLDSRFSHFQLGDDLFISTSDRTDEMKLRLIIRPSPLLMDPAEVLPAKMKEKTSSNCYILGHLSLLGFGFERVFPGQADPSDYIQFIGLGEYGFSAYVDFTLRNGNIVEDQLFMKIDGDGDGYFDYEVSGVLESGHPGGLGPDGIGCSPNPFNAGVRVDWRIENGEGSALAIYDLTGKLVRTIILDGGMSGVEYFDGRDRDGQALASGLYFVTLRDSNGRVRTTGKMTILK